MSPCPALHRSLRSRKTRNKKAHQNSTATASRSDPNPRELKRASLQKHPTKGSIAFGTQKSRARHCQQISLILAAAHFKSVNIRKRIARLFGRIVIVSQNYCAIFVSPAQQVGICLIKVLTRWPENARP